MMCVSAEFCEAHLQLLFTILEKSTDPVIRSNIIIALGDMTVSFNSLIDQNIAYLYNRLGDHDLVVKKNTLMVLTHLILNGMVKVKGQISEMAKCLEDENTKIADLAKLFFTELSSKDNAIYNNLPDIISNLSHPDIGIEEDKFASIMRFLFEFIDKEKQAENIADKLCLRFKNAPLPRQWRDISFCLTMLSWKGERSFKRLVDNLQYYGDKLHEDTLFKHLQDIVAKVRKMQKTEGKQMIDDYEKKLVEMREACVENETAVNAANEAANKLKPDRVATATRALSELNLEKPISKPASRVASRQATPSVEPSAKKPKLDRDTTPEVESVPSSVRKPARPPARKPVNVARPNPAKENTRRVDADDEDFF
jgi:condensin complex subunit 1